MPTVVRGYKTELDLNNEQRSACLNHAGACRFAYNWGLARSQEVYRTTGKRPSPMQLHKELNARKATEFPWMYEVSKCAPQEALRDLDKAYKNFFRRVELKKQGKWKGKLGFPVFKKKSKGIGSFRLTGKMSVYEDAIQLPRLGRLRLHEKKYLPIENVHILCATVSEQAGRWFVSLQVEEEQEEPTPTATSAIGVDVGVKTLATLSDGSIFENPRPFKQAQKKLRRLERQKSRRKLGGKNRKKTCKKLAKQHARVANIRKDTTHKLTSYLCKNHALVAIEDLHTAGMLKNHCLAGAVSDSNFGEIKRQLLYKREREGVFLVVIDRFHPSCKKCSCCGWINEELTLKERVFVCLDCGYVADRDDNAAKNILAQALRTTESSSESYACGERSAGAVNGSCETALAEAGTRSQLGMS
jgi:putative transposase